MRLTTNNQISHEIFKQCLIESGIDFREILSSHSSFPNLDQLSGYGVFEIADKHLTTLLTIVDDKNLKNDISFTSSKGNRSQSKN